MTQKFYFDILGYIASAVILTSFTMTSTVRLRLLNSVGAVLNIIYSYLIGAYPTAICNACILCINFVQLRRLLHNHQNTYSIVRCQLQDSVLKAFVAKYRHDIAQFYPHFRLDDPQQNFARFIFSRNEIVGLQVGIVQGDTLCLTLDYSIPEYRDCSVGRFAYDHISNKGIHQAYFTGHNERVRRYLSKMGFKAKGDKLALQIA
ncbi:MAG: YgjV family protein [bacterium]|nr:YgjV family protein [bacterium]